MDGLRYTGPLRFIGTMAALALLVGSARGVERPPSPRPRPTAAENPAPAASQHAHPKSSAATPPPTREWEAALQQLGQQRINHAFDLASRGAIHSAQHELLKLLGVVAQTLDTDQGTRAHSDALANALVALEEGEDYLKAIPQGGRSLAPAAIAASHRTTLLHQAGTHDINPIVAMQLYYSYAGNQFVVAAGGQAVAAETLFALGRVVSVMRDHPLERQTNAAPLFDQKMLVFYQAAWSIDPANHMAANEYGVILARFNQWTRAREAFEYSVAQHPEVQNTLNLAIAYEHVGEHALAKQARQLSQSLAVKSGATASNSIAPAVAWVDVETFAKSGSPAGWSSFPTGDDASGSLGSADPKAAPKSHSSKAASNPSQPEKQRGLISGRVLDRWKSTFRND